MKKFESHTTLSFVLGLTLLLVAQTMGQQPKDIVPAPVPAQIHSAKKVFISNGGGEELDPRTFGFPSVDPDRPYNQFYAAIKNSGRYETVSAVADADLVLEIRFTHSAGAVADVIGSSHDPILKLRLLDPKTGILLWAFTERVQAPAGPHWKEKREGTFNGAMTALLDDLTKIASVPSRN